MFRKSIIPLILAIIAGFSIWMMNRQANVQPAPPSRDDTSPDGFMQNFTSTVMDANGQPVYELTAQYMEHFPYDDHTQFRAPLVTVYREDGYRWTLVAEQGRAEQGTEKILLQGEVVMHRVAKAETTVDTEIVTRELLVLPDSSYAETDQHTVIVRGGVRVQSEGVRAYFNENRLQLLAQVKGIYEFQP